MASGHEKSPDYGGAEPKRLSESLKQGILLVVTGLAVSFVRHGLETHWHSWSSYEQFFLYWIIHTIGVAMLAGISGLVISFNHQRFLGYKKDDMDAFMFYALMTILIATIAIAIVANWVPSDDDDAAASTITIADTGGYDDVHLIDCCDAGLR